MRKRGPTGPSPTPGTVWGSFELWGRISHFSLFRLAIEEAAASRNRFRDIRMTHGAQKAVRVGHGAQAAQRARESAARAHQLDARPPVVAVVDHADPVGALAAWAASTLIVPPGHPRSGEPMALLQTSRSDWLRASWDAHESALSTARKNAKISDCGGPGARLPGGSAAASWLAWGDCVSISKEKAGELRRQVARDCRGVGLDVRIRRSPYPGVIESHRPGVTRHAKSADRTAGHASGYDLVIVDETGLLPERARDLLAGLRS